MTAPPYDRILTPLSRNVPASAEQEEIGFVSYHGDFEDAYRRSDGDETGWRVPEHLIRAREIAQRQLDAANRAIGDYITAHQVPEIDLDTEEPITGPDTYPPA